jgi:hypothetical protein
LAHSARRCRFSGLVPPLPHEESPTRRIVRRAILLQSNERLRNDARDESNDGGQRRGHPMTDWSRREVLSVVAAGLVTGELPRVRRQLT